MFKFKDKIYKYFIISFIYEIIISIRNKIIEDSALNKLGKKGFNIETINQAFSNINPNNFKRCHILGLGWSLNRSKYIIGKEDFVIGMNYGALNIDIKYNIYFLEHGNISELENIRRNELLEKLILPKAKVVYFKNVHGMHCIDTIAKYFGKYVTFIRNTVFVCRNIKNLKFWIRRILTIDKIYLRQYKSTIITSIVFARNAGFKEIVIHGLDFGGPYFYADEKHVEPKYLHLIPNRENQNETVKVHETAKTKTGAKQAILVMNDLMKKEGVKLYAATEASPLSKILKTFDKSI